MTVDLKNPTIKKHLDFLEECDEFLERLRLYTNQCHGGEDALLMFENLFSIKLAVRNRLGDDIIAVASGAK